MSKSFTTEQVSCYHCGEACDTKHIRLEEKNFCCEGCKMVYEIINRKGLCDYYTMAEKPGITQKHAVRAGKFAFLDNPDISGRLVQFAEGNRQQVTFYLPQMHCSSCIWLLEQLPKLHAGVIGAQVQFLKKEITIAFNPQQATLRQLAELLAGIGYEPHISLNDLTVTAAKSYDKSRLYKLGIAGFCFGNIMLLSFPEYFSSGAMEEAALKQWFSYLNLGLSLPVFFYCASGFFSSAYKSLKQRFLNIDAPIALAILITFARSVYEIVSGTGAGYLDSMSGIVFFMLIGRFFQDKSYQALHFERTYTSYFPIGVTVIRGDGREEQVPVSELKKEDRVRIHHDEIIPADCILFLGKATIDYSFVTGESLPVEKSIGELVYAGGRQTGGAIELEVVREVSQSYLTQLWNSDVFKKEKNRPQASFVHRLSRYFTYILFSIALVTGIYWSAVQPSLAWSAVTAVLIVACPCALLLSATFTNAGMLGILQQHGFYVKNAQVLEAMRQTDTIVFDKTGTISLQQGAAIRFIGQKPTALQQQLIRSLAAQSHHPLSRNIVAALPLQKNLPVKNYHEEPGKGSIGLVNGRQVRIGSAKFAGGHNTALPADGSRVYVWIDGQTLGFYAIKTSYRPLLTPVIHDLKKDYRLALLSGDNNSEEFKLRGLFGKKSELLFNQHPHQKLAGILRLQQQGRRVVMIGDGLNDAGALRQSNVGIAITDNVNNFSPGSDIIMDGKQFAKLPALLRFCKQQQPIIYGSFIISILYNIIGLSFAVQGTLSPVIAAILMPVSSVSIVLFTTLVSRWLGRKLK